MAKSSTLPAFFPWTRNVTPSSLKQDLFAGLTGAVIALPQGVAFAVLAGLPPEYGLYTAIIPVIVAALFGSSHHLVCGPTTPISLVIFATLAAMAPAGSSEYVSLVLSLTFLAGLFQLAMGAARLGVLVNFISHAVLVGFTAAAALLIITSQMKHILGVEIASGLSFANQWLALFNELHHANPYTVAITLFTLISALLITRLLPKWPGYLIAMIAGGLLAFALGGERHHIAVVGALPSHLPPIALPDLSMDRLYRLFADALAIALLGLVEAVTIARSISAFSHQRLNANREFIGQGLSNLAGSVFSSYASSGSFTRSALNFRSGAQTPLAAIFSALAVAVMLLTAAPLAAYLPIAAMSGILLIVAYRLIDFYHIKVIFKANPTDAAVLVITFAATLLTEITFAIYLGVLTSLVLHLHRISHPSILSRVPDASDASRRFTDATAQRECPQLKILRIDGSMFFGSVNDIEQTLRDMMRQSPNQRHVLLACSGVNFIDVAGAEFLTREAARWRAHGGDLYLCDVKSGVYDVLKRGGYLAQLGDDHLFTTKAQAIAAIYPRLNAATCQSCTVRLFTECQSDIPDQPSAIDNHPR